MDKNSKSKIIKLIAFIVGLILIVAGIGIFAKPKTEVVKYSNLDGFAQCINDSGAKFYGTFWCSFCGKQKESFGSAKQYLPYVECSTPDGKGMLEVCKKEGIDGFPTWKFTDGTELSGLQDLEVLATKTSCELPTAEI
jgi:hypothetical protein